MIGTAALRHHDALRHLGAEPIDYDDARLDERVRELAPNGVQAVFDHLGGESFRRSFDLLASGGTLVGYGTATQRDGSNNLVVTFAGIFARSRSGARCPTVAERPSTTSGVGARRGLGCFASASPPTSPTCWS